ncbi:MAG: preprotein translocase subunit SecG [Eubacteriales bacterium]
MDIIAIIIASVDILICVALVLLVILQEGNDKGMGVIGGGADTFFGKEKGRSIDSTLKKITSALAILFAILTVILYLILAKGL